MAACRVRWGWMALAVAVVLLIVGPGCIMESLAFVMGRSSRPAPGPRVIQVYYYDLNTSKLFIAASDQIPPIDTASGPTPGGMPAGVRAYVFACNDCNNEADRFIGWLEMYTKEAKQLLAGPAKPGNLQTYEDIEKGQLISEVGGKWVRANSPDAITITSKIETKCPGGAPKPCLPGR